MRCFRSDVKCAALTHGACGEKWQDAALSPHLSADGQTLRACSTVSHRKETQAYNLQIRNDSLVLFIC
ncbi:hypothetical protein KUCAC02_018047 [Chaenocephalus aceratus]|uniref:Uncharacterized protein n=1 Tax=Chaenocephalus aceratus TaxID=36190 RepID=A0ACB9W885_CHAAC|nr:hypothetical protein KUCAC02_018047 [Chaenocephalus aceratus]